MSGTQEVVNSVVPWNQEIVLKAILVTDLIKVYCCRIDSVC